MNATNVENDVNGVQGGSIERLGDLQCVTDELATMESLCCSGHYQWVLWRKKVITNQTHGAIMSTLSRMARLRIMELYSV